VAIKLKLPAGEMPALIQGGKDEIRRNCWVLALWVESICGR